MGRDYMIINPSADDRATIQAALDLYRVVELAAGGVFILDSHLIVPSDRVLKCSSADRATIVRADSSKRTIVINGSNVLIKNLTIDFAFGGPWEEFASCIGFSFPDSDTTTPVQKSNIRLLNLRFVDSENNVTHTGGDAWAIDFRSDSPGISTGIEVIGCQQLAPLRQLTANGNGPGYDGVMIRGNKVVNGKSNSIAMSTSTTDFPMQFKNITVRDNFLLGCQNIGIFIGQDGQLISGSIDLVNVLIENNYIGFEAGIPDFSICVLLRVGKGSGVGSGLVVDGNKFDVARAVASQPRSMQFEGRASDPLTFTNNRSLGVAQPSLTQCSLTESGNVFADGTSWSLLS